MCTCMISRAKFDKIVDTKFGQGFMKKELELLEAANQELVKKCVIKAVANEMLPAKERLFGHGVMGYQLNTEIPECQYFAMREEIFLGKLRAEQEKRLAKIK